MRNTKAHISKSVNTLIGIIEGIAVDQLINDQEIETAEQAVKILDNLAQSRYSIVIELINAEGENERLRFR